MKKFKIKSFAKFFITFIIAFSLLTLTVFAKNDDDEDNYYKNRDTGYEAYVIDNADYLTTIEEEKLLKQLKELTEFTNVVFLTDENNTSYSESYSDRLCAKTMEALFDDDTAVIYLIDNEYDYIASQGDARKTISSGKCRTIADNVYKYSADEDFYKAANVAFTQIEDLFQGKKFAEPMKYICNAFIALFAALLINYLIVNSKSQLKKAKIMEIIEGTTNTVKYTDSTINHTGSTRRYAPRSSSSGGGGHYGGGHHGGGFHGGHSGGGHSH